METWMRRIGSKAAKNERKEARLSGALNKPIRRRRKLDVGHKLDCVCAGCVPLWMAEELKGLMERDSRPRVHR